MQRDKHSVCGKHPSKLERTAAPC